MSAVTEIFDKLMSNQKKILIWLIIAVIAFFLYKKLKKLFAKNSVNTMEDEAGVRPSFPLSQYHAWAEKLYTAMNGIGTDVPAVFDVFKRLQNSADWVSLNRVFGVRKGETLVEWLNDDLNPREMETVNKYLSKFGVTI